MVFIPPIFGAAAAWVPRLAAEFPQVEMVTPADSTAAVSEIQDAQAAFGRLTPELLAAAAELRWLQAPQAAPPAGFYFDELVAHPVQVTNFRGIFNDHISYHILGLILSFTKHFHQYRDLQSRKEWRPLGGPGYNTIYPPEASVLIVGVGGIGAETAKLCKAVGMRVTATDVRVTEAPEGVDELHGPEALPRLASEADFVVVTIPHTPDTEGMFDRTFFAGMRPSGIFINIGRGMTTKLDDLDQALRDGVIGGAGLDVFEIEPLPSDHPLWDAPNTIITPHVAVQEAAYLDDRRYAIVEGNLRRFLAGEPLLNVVDKSVWF